MKKWAEISNRPSRARFEALRTALATAGLESEVEFIECPIGDVNRFEEIFAEAKKKYDQLRIGGPLADLPLRNAERLPASLVALQAADAIVKSPLSEPGRFDWWPRNYTFEGLQLALVRDLKNIDVSGPVFVLGAGPDARAVIGAMTRIGFSKFALSDPDESRGRALATELKKRYFNLTLQFIPRHMITQLPSVHTAAVNTLSTDDDDGTHSELFYFNFLKPGGLWLDLPFEGFADLDVEAGAIGALVESGPRLAAWIDREWAQDAWGVSLELEALVESYEKTRRPSGDDGSPTGDASPASTP